MKFSIRLLTSLSLLFCGFTKSKWHLVETEELGKPNNSLSSDMIEEKGQDYEDDEDYEEETDLDEHFDYNDDDEYVPMDVSVNPGGREGLALRRNR